MYVRAVHLYHPRSYGFFLPNPVSTNTIKNSFMYDGAKLWYFTVHHKTVGKVNRFLLSNKIAAHICQ